MREISKAELLAAEYFPLMGWFGVKKSSW